MRVNLQLMFRKLSYWKHKVLLCENVKDSLKKVNCDSQKKIQDISNVIADIDSVTNIHSCGNSSVTWQISFSFFFRRITSFMNDECYYLIFNKKNKNIFLTLDIVCEQFMYFHTILTFDIANIMNETFKFYQTMITNPEPHLFWIVQS